MSYFIDEKTKALIGFNYLVKQLNINSPYGKKYFKKMKPFEDKTLLNEEFRLVEVFTHLINSSYPVEKIMKIFKKMKDIEKTLDNCMNHHVLDIVDLYEIKIQAILMNELKRILDLASDDYLQINGCTNIIHVLSENKNKITYDFYIYNSYSEKLKSIRKEKRDIEHLFFKAKDELTKENIKIKRSKLVILEEEEELNIRKKLSRDLQHEVHVMKENVKIIGHLDVLIAKAQLALAYDGIKPNISDRELILEEMMNPYIKLQVEKDSNSYINNSICLQSGTTVITGANMSGKSSILKTVALNVLLAHLGFFIFAKKAKIPLFQKMKYLANELDSTLHGLSSFGQEINKLNAAICTLKKEKCFIFMDEFARSTNPSEGQKFVRAFAEFAHTFNSYTLMATHYDGVVRPSMNHYQIAGLKEDAFESDDTLEIVDIHRFMDYTLKKVSLNEEVPKEAYKVSLLLNIDKDYKAYLDKNYRSDVNE